MSKITDQLDRIEDKLDRYAQQTVQNTADIAWIKGGVKIVIPIVITLMSFLAYELYREVILPNPINKEYKYEKGHGKEKE